MTNTTRDYSGCEQVVSLESCKIVKKKKDFVYWKCRHIMVYCIPCRYVHTYVQYFIMF